MGKVSLGASREVEECGIANGSGQREQPPPNPDTQLVMLTRLGDVDERLRPWGVELAVTYDECASSLMSSLFQRGTDAMSNAKKRTRT